MTESPIRGRRQRALQGSRSDDGHGLEGSVFETPGSLVCSPLAEQPVSEERGAGSWPVTRISEVLHRRLVAPVLEQVGGGDRASTSPTWHTPTHATDVLLLPPETRRHGPRILGVDNASTGPTAAS